jgi:hypothetical protein
VCDLYFVEPQAWLITGAIGSPVVSSGQSAAGGRGGFGGWQTGFDVPANICVLHRPLARLTHGQFRSVMAIGIAKAGNVRCGICGVTLQDARLPIASKRARSKRGSITRAERPYAPCYFLHVCFNSCRSFCLSTSVGACVM